MPNINLTAMQFLKFLIANLLVLHNGPLFLKFKSTFLLGLAVSPIAYIFDRIIKWGLTNQDYIYLVLGAIVIDHVLGSFYHAFIKRDFTWKRNFTGIAIKVSLVIMVGFIFEGLNHITKMDSFLQEYLIIVTRVSVFLYPAGSALMNSAEITGGVFPPLGWMDWLKRFNTTLETRNPNSNHYREPEEVSPKIPDDLGN